MSAFKLSPLEELRLEKKRIREERDIAAQRLSYQIQYLNDNWGSLITKGIASSVRTRFSETVDSFVSGHHSSHDSPFFTRRTNPWLSLITSNLPLIGGFVWKVTKPAILAFVAKKASSMLFRKKKK
ncbi:MAG: hypothetical protein LBI15_11890 [Dysgonamonadaceae bacterium]|jgi:hypothetical protein|nr:hypothetical protein [Dysgonamonadaceae bacterium]